MVRRTTHIRLESKQKVIAKRLENGKALGNGRRGTPLVRYIVTYTDRPRPIALQAVAILAVLEWTETTKNAESRLIDASTQA